MAVLGPSAALRLGIRDVASLPAIGIGDDTYLVVGILDGVARRPELLGAVIIPEGTARREFRLLVPEFVVVGTAIGASALISQQIPAALRPDDPRAIQVASPPEPRRVRDNVERDLNALFFALGAVSLVVGAIGIANVTLVSIIERTGEIGLRRALGATRRHIATQFLLESGSMGLVGGTLGDSLGTLIRRWRLGLSVMDAGPGPGRPIPDSPHRGRDRPSRGRVPRDASGADSACGCAAIRDLIHAETRACAAGPSASTVYGPTGIRR